MFITVHMSTVINQTNRFTLRLPYQYISDFDKNTCMNHEVIVNFVAPFCYERFISKDIRFWSITIDSQHAFH